MTLSELWQLFPIFLVDHQANWEQWYVDEATYLSSLLPCTTKINHIGSTAISTIKAKSIIDILAEVDLREFSAVKNLLVAHDYICMSEDERRIDFNKGYTPLGFAEKVFHLHLREYGDNDELYFRDYLNEHENIAKQYERLKLSLGEKYEHNRDAYTEGKTDFVHYYTREAKREYGKRY